MVVHMIMMIKIKRNEEEEVIGSLGNCYISLKTPQGALDCMEMPFNCSSRSSSSRRHKDDF